MISDLIYAIRRVLRRPSVFLTVIVTLAIGATLNSLAYSFLNGILLAPLEYSESSNIVRIRIGDRSSGLRNLTVPYQVYYSISSSVPELSNTAAYSLGSSVLRTEQGAHAVRTIRSTSSLFETLRSPTLLGRFYTSEEVASAAPVALLSESFWSRQYTSDSEMIGDFVTLNERRVRVIGVVPDKWNYPPHAAPDLWLPLDQDRRQGESYLQLVGRLRTGETRSALQGRLDLVWPAILEGSPSLPDTVWPTVMTLGEEVSSPYRESAILFYAASCIVLLIGVCNVTFIMLADWRARQPEVAQRIALGAGRSQVLSQLLAETFVSFTCGSALGVVTAWLLREYVVSLMPPTFITPFVSARMTFGWAVLSETFAVVWIYGLLVAVAMLSATSNVFRSPTIAAAAIGTLETRPRHVRRVLAVVQLALCIGLLVAAGNLLQSLVRVYQLPVGFDPTRVALFDLYLPRDRYGGEDARRLLFQNILDDVSSAPGVELASVTNALPLAGTSYSRSFRITGFSEDAANDIGRVGFRIVGPTFFNLMGIPLLQGRFFTESDSNSSMPVIIINEQMMLALMAQSANIESIIEIKNRPHRIVGVVGDVRHDKRYLDPQPEIYQCYLQEGSRGFTILMKFSGRVRPSWRMVEELVWKHDSGLPLYNPRMLSEVISASMASWKAVTFLYAFFGGHCQVNEPEAVFALEVARSFSLSASTSGRLPVSKSSLSQESMMDRFELMASHSKQIVNEAVDAQKSLKLWH